MITKKYTCGKSKCLLHMLLMCGGSDQTEVLILEDSNFSMNVIFDVHWTVFCMNSTFYKT